MLNNTSVTRFVTLIAFMVMGVIIIWLWRGKTEPQQPTSETKTTSEHRGDSLTGKELEPERVIKYVPVETRPDYSKLPFDQLLEAMNKLSDRMEALEADHNAINQYEKNFGDSTYKETINFEITKNKLKSFTRNIDFIHKETTITNPPKPARFALLGGGFGYSDGLHTAAGFQLSGQTVRGDLYSVGYDVLNKGWYGSVQFKVRLRK
jgi:hypothetical protein